AYSRATWNALNLLGEKFDICKPTTCKKKCANRWNQCVLIEDRVEYYQGWYLTGKEGKESTFLNLVWVWNKLGSKTAKQIHKAAREYSYTRMFKSIKNFRSNLVRLFEYMEKNRPLITIDDINDPLYVTKLYENYFEYYFKSNSKEGRCIDSAIDRWNKSVDFLDYSLIRSNAFARPLRKIPSAPSTYKSGSECRIVKNVDGTSVKSKLMTEIPIEVTDDEAIELLCEKIMEDIDVVVKWAEI